MQKYRSILRRRAILSLLDWCVIVLCLLVWVVVKQPVPHASVLSYSQVPDHILVQLATLPGRAETQRPPDPLWTLYGDGRLVYKLDPSDTFWQAHLAPGDIQYILYVLVHQDTFFDTPPQRDGKLTLYSDDDDLLLMVNINGQRKTVVLESEPSRPQTSDRQTAQGMALVQFLRAYQPPHAILVAPPPDSEQDSDEGEYWERVLPALPGRAAARVPVRAAGSGPAWGSGLILTGRSAG
jgi:hypothetical protein